MNKHLFRPATTMGLLLAFAWCSALHGQEPPSKGTPAPQENAAPPIPSDETSPEVAPLPKGPLPWKRGGGTKPRATASGSARETLAGLGIGEQELAEFHDRQPPSESETKVLYRLLYRLSQMRRSSIAAWTAPTVDWQQLLDDPSRRRAEFFHIVGRVRKAVQVGFPAEAIEFYDVPPTWQVTIECEGAPGPVQLLTFDVPSDWLTAEQLDQPVEADGLFLKLGGEGDDTEFVFAAQRVAWYPTEADRPLGVEQDHVFFAALGLDMAELADVGDRSQTLTREPFYQLLAAVGLAEPAELQRRGKPFDIVKLLKQSDDLRGQVITLSGRAEQITKILVDDEDIRQRYGIDHYYEIDMFVPLETTLQITDPNDESKQLTYHEYPVTVCVRELPTGLAEPDKANVFETVRTEITLPAVFFKVWAVSTVRARKLGGDRKQFNPLFIGLEPEIVEREELPVGMIGAVVAVVFIVALGAAWLGVWRTQKGDRKFERETLNKQFEVEPGKSLDEMGIEAEGAPDFSGLAEHDSHDKPTDEA